MPVWPILHVVEFRSPVFAQSPQVLLSVSAAYRKDQRGAEAWHFMQAVDQLRRMPFVSSSATEYLLEGMAVTWKTRRHHGTLLSERYSLESWHANHDRLRSLPPGQARQNRERRMMKKL